MGHARSFPFSVIPPTQPCRSESPRYAHYVRRLSTHRIAPQASHAARSSIAPERHRRHRRRVPRKESIMGTCDSTVCTRDCIYCNRRRAPHFQVSWLRHPCLQNKRPIRRATVGEQISALSLWISSVGQGGGTLVYFRE